MKRGVWMKNIIKALVIVFIGTMILPMKVSAKKYSCEIVDGAYYNKNGKEVDKVEYEKSCVTHTCEIVGDTYYGKDSKTVNKETFEKDCKTAVVESLPNTSSNISTISIIFTIIGTLMILATIIGIRKYNNEK